MAASLLHIIGRVVGVPRLAASFSTTAARHIGGLSAAAASGPVHPAAIGGMAAGVPVLAHSSDAGVVAPRVRPAGAFRINPKNKTEWLMESDVSSAAANCRLLLDAPRAPRPVALQRVLHFVNTKEDLTVALKCYNMCRTKGVKFDVNTSSLLVSACIRAGSVQTAIDKLRDSNKTRLLLSEASLRRLLAECARLRDPALLSATIACAWHFGYNKKQVNLNTTVDMIVAYAVCGDVESALRGYAKLAASCAKRPEDGVPLLHLRVEPLKAILDAAIAAPPSAAAAADAKGGVAEAAAPAKSVYPPAVSAAHLARVAAEILPVARKLVAGGEHAGLAEKIVKFEQAHPEALAAPAKTTTAEADAAVPAEEIPTPAASSS